MTDAPNHKQLPPVDINRLNREYSVRARFAPLPESGRGLQSLILRFTTEDDPWAPDVRYLDVMAYGPGEDPAGRVGWRSAEGPWLPLVGFSPSALDSALAPDRESSVMVSVRGGEARVSVNGWFVGTIFSERWVGVRHVTAYPDIDGFFPEGRYSNAQASGYLVEMHTSGPVAALAWAMLGLSAGTLLLASVVIGISLRK